MIFTRLNAAVDGWFTAPEPRGAGRTGLYRIVFSVFYLWHLSSHVGANLGGLPDGLRARVLLVDWVGGAALSPRSFEVLESGLVAALVILMIGYRVRLATAAVLILGGIYEACFFSVSGEHATIPLTFYIPLSMLLAGNWGATYSLDALLARRAGRPTAEPGDSSWCYALPGRAVLVVLAALFFSSAVFKVAFGATWLTRPGLFANVMLEKNVKAAIRELPMNPLAPTFAQMPQLADLLAYLLVVFEGTFLLVLLSPKLRNVYLSLALMIHAASALWLVVTFTPVLAAYGLFVDWQALRERLRPGRVALVTAVAPRTLVWATLGVAVATGLLWNTGPGLRAVINLNGVLNWRTIWYPVLPLAVAWWLLASADLVRAATRVRARLTPSPAGTEPRD